jgi:hypothetical protein
MKEQATKAAFHNKGCRTGPNNRPALTELYVFVATIACKFSRTVRRSQMAKSQTSQHKQTGGYGLLRQSVGRTDISPYHCINRNSESAFPLVFEQLLVRDWKNRLVHFERGNMNGNTLWLGELFDLSRLFLISRSKF